MKRPNGIREWLTFILTVVAIVATACFAYEAVVQRVGVVEVKAEKTLMKVELHDTAIIEMKGDVGRIKNDVAEIKDDIKEILRRSDQ